MFDCQIGSDAVIQHIISSASSSSDIFHVARTVVPQSTSSSPRIRKSAMRQARILLSRVNCFGSPGRLRVSPCSRPNLLNTPADHVSTPSFEGGIILPIVLVSSCCFSSSAAHPPGRTFRSDAKAWSTGAGRRSGLEQQKDSP